MIRILVGIMLIPVITPLVVAGMTWLHVTLQVTQQWDAAALTDPRWLLAVAAWSLCALPVALPVLHVLRRNNRHNMGYFISLGMLLGGLPVALLGSSKTSFHITWHWLPSFSFAALSGAVVGGIFWLIAVWNNPSWRRR
ncbi:MAG: hypothetical protein Tsb002_25730 [Wenzhouxiangellaceae bacterium]